MTDGSGKNSGTAVARMLLQEPFWPLMILLAVAPLTLITAAPWPLSALSAAAGGLLIWWGIGCARSKAPLTAPWRQHGVTTLAVCLLLGWFAAQSVPGVVPVWNHPLWRDAATALGHPLTGAISLDPTATGDALVRLMGYFAVFWLAMQFGRDPRRGRLTLWVVASTCTAIALWGLIQQYALSTGDAGSWAGMAGAGTPALCLGIGAVTVLALTTWPESPRPRLLDPKHLTTAIPLAMFGLIVTALLFSRSGSEIICAVIAFAAFTAIRFTGSGLRIGTSLSAGLAAGAGAMAAIVVGGWISGWSLAGPGESGIGLIAHALRAISDTPLTGQGLGTFGEGFHLYHDGNLTWLAPVYNGAPTAYLELALGAGVAAAAALVGIIAWLATACIRGIRARDGDVIGPATALSVTVLLGCHAAIGTGLEHPAVAVLFAAILGVGFAASSAVPRQIDAGQSSDR